MTQEYDCGSQIPNTDIDIPPIMHETADRIEELETHNAWQPIETAPKDGTRVILYCSNNRQCIAYWKDVPFCGKGWFVLIPCMNGYGEGSDTHIHWDEDQPTHWMHLPQPPKEAQG